MVIPGGLLDRVCAERSAWCLMVATDKGVSFWWLTKSENKPPFLSTVICGWFSKGWVGVFMLPPGCVGI